LDVAQDAFAGGGGDVGDGDVARERAAFRADAPDVEVVDVVDAVDPANGGFEFVKFHATGGAFEQDVHGLAQDAKGGPKDQGANAEGEGGVDPVVAGGENDPAADDDGRGGESIADFVQQRAADVDVAAGAI